MTERIPERRVHDTAFVFASLPEDENFTFMMRQAVTDCNGFVYHGDSLEAQIRLVKWMRMFPKDAEILLGTERP